jgi:hypothetical protein
MEAMWYSPCSAFLLQRSRMNATLALCGALPGCSRLLHETTSVQPLQSIQTTGSHTEAICPKLHNRQRQRQRQRQRLGTLSVVNQLLESHSAMS